MAKECDKNRSTLTEVERKNKPMYGIPFSVKDHFMVKGMVATCGMIRNANNYASENGRVI